jgi:hypothetical protein
MDRNTPKLWFLRVVLGLALLIGLFPVPHALSMQSGHMQIPSQTGTMPTGQDMPMTCCGDTIGSYHLLCGFVLPHFASATHSAGTDRVALLTFSIQLSSRDIATPPPKF